MAVPPATLASVALAPYACDPARTRGRRHAQAPAPTRSEFQRDRDRIIHSAAFRRLVYKTQVFLNHEGDLFRTRLTHSLEVAQLARSIGRTLQLNEDLIEAIALAHDLGHTPFGHAGQDALHACMATEGGFEHNLQSLRVVDVLEDSYPAHPGLNLCFETREGILKHCNPRVAAQLGDVGERFVQGLQPSLEAQLCNLADEIAYNTHDLDDGVRSGLLSTEQVRTVPLVAGFFEQAQCDHPDLKGRRLLLEVLRRMLSALVYDLIDHTAQALKAHAPTDVDAVRHAPPLVGFSRGMREQVLVLKRFLRQQLYRHPQVVWTTERAKTVVTDLFGLFDREPSRLPSDFSGRRDRRRAVADYIAGMTDRFALHEHQRLLGGELFDLSGGGLASRGMPAADG